MVNYVYDLSDNNVLIQDDNIPLIKDNVKFIIDTFKVFISSPPLSLKKKRHLKGLKNYITNNTPLEN
jgi:hypothetical protein